MPPRPVWIWRCIRLTCEAIWSTCPSLTAQELKRLPDGARLMTLECGLRFLTDYLQGDPYFATTRPGQNLDRCRTQMGLVQVWRTSGRHGGGPVRRKEPCV